LVNNLKFVKRIDKKFHSKQSFCRPLDSAT